MFSQSEEDYLKAIYEQQYERGSEWVTTSALAQQLHVSPASVTEMVKKLAAREPALLEYERYHGAQLTGEGVQAAREVVRHHRLIEAFLTKALGLPWDRVHDEAHRLEHAVSEELEDRIALYLGEPARDPHGSPIPRRDGEVEALDDVPLSDLPPGQPARVRRVLDEDPALLRYLSELGLIVGARLEVTGRAPFEGPLYVRLIGQAAPRALGEGVTGAVFVVAEGEPAG
jgi:DtxR family transcriptional regulator, Mn-dependent transcriptional regulator